MPVRQGHLRRGWVALIVALVLWLVAYMPPTEVLRFERAPGTSPLPEHAPRNALAAKRCPPQHTADHGLVNTGRRALVFYTFTSHDNLQDRQIELDNYLFFQAHGVVAPDTPTALFSAVDYIVIRSDLTRTAGNNSASDDVEGVRECGAGGLSSTVSHTNVRFVETPSGPCDLCSVGRTIKALGGAEAVARAYEFIVSVNSGTRGPFFSEAPGSRDGVPPVTWIDHMALGGEKVYTGAVMSSNNGISVGTGRPFLFSFSFGMPASALLALQPVLIAGCVRTRLPGLWFALLRAFDIDHHRDVGREEAFRIVRAALNKTDAQPIRFHANDAPAVRAAKRKVAAVVADGFNRSKSVLKHVLELLQKKAETADPWDDNVKMRCVVRSEGQIMKSIMDARLPPPRSPEIRGDRDRRAIGRPLLTIAEAALLSPVLSGYLHEGHFFARSMNHDETMANMGHAHAVLSRPQPQDMYMVDPCRVVFLKFGGVGWRGKMIPTSVVARVQELALVQRPPSSSAVGCARAAFAHVLHCASPVPLRPSASPKSRVAY